MEVKMKHDLQQLMMDNTFTNENFSKKALNFLERDFRKICLQILSDISLTDLSLKLLFSELTTLQRPSWGCWNGLLSGLLKYQKKILNTGTLKERQELLKAKHLLWALKEFDTFYEIDDTHFKNLCSKITGYTFGKREKSIVRAKDLFIIPIQIRNRVAHDNPENDEWWSDVVYILKYIINIYLSTPIPYHLQNEDFYEPWTIKRDQEIWYYNGINCSTSVNTVYYISQSGKSEAVNQMLGPIIKAFQKLLGQTEVQEENFKRLMEKNAPQEVRGFILDNYIVGKKAGEGGYAEVFKGRHLNTGKTVAIKILKSGMSDMDKARFLREAEFLSKFDHPNIVGIYDHNEQPWKKSGLYDISGEEWFDKFKKEHGEMLTYIALEWIEGCTLDDLFNDIKQGHKSYNEKELAEWFRSCANALEVIHNADLIHRDITPKNIMINENGEIKIMDFGISKTQYAERTIITSRGKALGTEAYMSPEQINTLHAESAIGTKTDIYSLGAIFYELFTCSRIYEHNNNAVSISIATEKKLKGEKPKDPRTLVKSMSWEISVILTGCLETEQTDRYESALKLKNDLNNFINDKPIEYKKPGLVRRLYLFYKRNEKISKISAVFILIIIVFTSIYVKTKLESNLNNKIALAKMYYRQAHQEIADENHRFALTYLVNSLKQNPSPYVTAQIALLLQNEKWPMAVMSFIQDDDTPPQKTDNIPGTFLTASHDNWLIYKTESNYIFYNSLSGSIRTFTSNGETNQYYDEFYNDLVFDIYTASGIVLYDTGNYLAFADKGFLYLYIYKSDFYEEYAKYDLALLFEQPLLTSPFDSLLKDTTGIYGSSYKYLGPSKVFINRENSILAISNFGSVVLLDLNDGSVITSVIEYQYNITSLEFSPDSSKIAISWGNQYGASLRNEGGYFKVFDIRTGKDIINTRTQSNNAVGFVSFSPDGTLVLSAGINNDIVFIWDISTGLKFCQPLISEGSVYKAQFTDDSCFIDVTSKSTIDTYKTTRWKLPKNETDNLFIKVDPVINKIKACDFGLLVARQNDLYLFNEDSGELIWKYYTGLKYFSFIESIDIDSVNNRILLSYFSDLSGTNAGGVQIIDFNGNAISSPLFFDHNIKKAIFSPDRSKVLIVFKESSDAGYVQIFDITEAGFMQLSEPIRANKGIESGFSNAVWSNDGKYIFAVDMSGSVYVYKTSDLTVVHYNINTTDRLEFVTGVDITDDGKHLIILTGALNKSYGKITVYKTSELITRKNTEKTTLLQSIPEKAVLLNTRIAIACYDNTVLIFDYKTLTQTGPAIKGIGNISCISFDNTSNLLAIGRDTGGNYEKSYGFQSSGIFELWDITESMKLMYYIADNSDISSLTISEDNILYFAESTGTIHTRRLPYNITDHKILTSLERLSGYKLSGDITPKKEPALINDFLDGISEQKGIWEYLLKNSIE